MVVIKSGEAFSCRNWLWLSCSSSVGAGRRGVASSVTRDGRRVAVIVSA